MKFQNPILMILAALLLFSQSAIPQTGPLLRPIPRQLPNQKLLVQIQKNHPNLSKNYAVSLALVIDRVSKKYNVKASKLAAIAMQESAYTLNAKNCYVVKGKLRCDYCMMQINDRTIESFGLNQELLMSDVGYCVEAGAMILRDFKRMYGKREMDFWTRYNSSNPEKREAYKVAVERWL